MNYHLEIQIADNRWHRLEMSFATEKEAADHIAKIANRRISLLDIRIVSTPREIQQ